MFCLFFGGDAGSGVALSQIVAVRGTVVVGAETGGRGILSRAAAAAATAVVDRLRYSLPLLLLMRRLPTLASS